MTVTVHCANPTCASKLIIIGQRLDGARQRANAVAAALDVQGWVKRDRSGDPLTVGEPVCCRCAA